MNIQRVLARLGEVATAKWMNDDAIANMVGNGWIEDMDVSSGSINSPKDKKIYLNQANKWFKHNRWQYKAIDVKEAKGGNLDWKIEKS